MRSPGNGNWDGVARKTAAGVLLKFEAERVEEEKSADSLPRFLAAVAFGLARRACWGQGLK